MCEIDFVEAPNFVNSGLQIRRLLSSGLQIRNDIRQRI